MSIQGISGNVGPTQSYKENASLSLAKAQAGNPASSESGRVVEVFVADARKKTEELIDAQQGKSPEETERGPLLQKLLVELAKSGLEGPVKPNTSVDNHLQEGLAGIAHKSDLAKPFDQTRAGGNLRRMAAGYDNFQAKVGLILDMTA